MLEITLTQGPSIFPTTFAPKSFKCKNCGKRVKIRMRYEDDGAIKSTDEFFLARLCPICKKKHNQI